MATGAKLAIGGFIIVAVTAYMAYLGASSSWEYYLTADECVNNAETLVGDRIRVSGTVSPNTLRIAEDGTETTFSLTAADRSLEVVCSGPLPDNLEEGMDVVVEGRLEQSGVLRGDKVLTRCASKYESQDPADSSENTTGA